MGVLQRFERRLGGIVEGAFARVFKGGVEPVELAEALTRECDERRARGARRTLVPNEFTIHLSEPDFERLAPYRQALGDELATLVREHAAAQRYTFVAPVRRSRSSSTPSCRSGATRWTVTSSRLRAPPACRAVRPARHAGRRAAAALRAPAARCAGFRAELREPTDQPEHTARPAAAPADRHRRRLCGERQRRRLRAQENEVDPEPHAHGHRAAVQTSTCSCPTPASHAGTVSSCCSRTAVTSTATWAPPMAAGSTAARCTRRPLRRRRPDRGGPQRAGLSAIPYRPARAKARSGGELSGHPAEAIARDRRCVPGHPAHVPRPALALRAGRGAGGPFRPVRAQQAPAAPRRRPAAGLRPAAAAKTAAGPRGQQAARGQRTSPRADGPARPGAGHARAGPATRAWCWTTTSRRLTTPGWSLATASGSWRIWVRRTARTSIARRSCDPHRFPSECRCASARRSWS